MRLCAFRHHRQEALISLLADDEGMWLTRPTRLQLFELRFEPVVERVVLQLDVDVQLSREIAEVLDLIDVLLKSCIRDASGDENRSAE